MARTKGARDAKPRKRPQNTRKRATPARIKSKGPAGKPAANTPGPERPAIPPDEFRAAIVAELGGGGDPAGVTAPGEEVATSPAAFDPSGLTLDGLASAWQVPFWALGWVLKILRVIPDPEPVMEVGKRRAKDLAKPSYEIYVHYAREYLDLNPENSIHVAVGVTALNAIGILPDLTEAIFKARREWLESLRQPVQPRGPTNE